MRVSQPEQMAVTRYTISLGNGPLWPVIEKKFDSDSDSDIYLIVIAR